MTRFLLLFAALLALLLPMAAPARAATLTDQDRADVAQIVYAEIGFADGIAGLFPWVLVFVVANVPTSGAGE